MQSCRPRRHSRSGSLGLCLNTCCSFHWNLQCVSVSGNSPKEPEISHHWASAKENISQMNDYHQWPSLPRWWSVVKKLGALTHQNLPPSHTRPIPVCIQSHRTTEDAISLSLPTTLTQLERQNTYVRMLFVDRSFAFNTITPSKLTFKFVEDTILLFGN